MKKTWLILAVTSLFLPGMSARAQGDLPSLQSSNSDNGLQLTGALDVSLSSDKGQTADGLPRSFLAQPPMFANHFASSQISLPGREGADDTGFDSGLMNLQGGVGVDWGDDRLMLPVYHQEMRLDRERSYKYDALGVEWSRRFDSRNLVSLSAQYGDYVYADQSGDTTNTMAAVAWSGEFSGAMRPRLTSSLYLGDEAAKDEMSRFLGRRYYGVTLDGRFSPFRNHSPYASLRLQRSDYGAEDPVLSVSRREDHSRLAAGWDWQVRPNWGLRAEANYSLNNSTLESYGYDHTQFFFTTRFDFR
jgi:hypothetical protein